MIVRTTILEWLVGINAILTGVLLIKAFVPGA
jgi:hypothetical protein